MEERIYHIIFFLLFFKKNLIQYIQFAVICFFYNQVSNFINNNIARFVCFFSAFLFTYILKELFSIFYSLNILINNNALLKKD